MKKKTLFRIALFAVMTFMGAIGLSAQNWVSEPTALVIIQTQVTTALNTPVPVGNNANQTLTTPLSQSLKVIFLNQVADRIKTGETTGNAVNNTNQAFSIAPGADAGDRQQMVTDVYNKVVTLLTI